MNKIMKFILVIVISVVLVAAVWGFMDLVFSFIEFLYNQGFSIRYMVFILCVLCSAGWMYFALDFPVGEKND